MPHMNQFMLEDLLKYYKIDIHTNASVIETTDTAVKLKVKDEVITLPCDTLITSVGYVKNDSLYEQLKELPIHVYNVGDSSQVRNIMYSIWNAHEISRNL